MNTQKTMIMGLYWLSLVSSILLLMACIVSIISVSYSRYEISKKHFIALNWGGLSIGHEIYSSPLKEHITNKHWSYLPHIRYFKVRPWVWSFYSVNKPQYQQLTIPLWIPLVCSIILFVLSRRKVIRESGRKNRSCSTCNYSLIGNLSGICPECGTEFDPELLKKLPIEEPSHGQTNQAN